MIRDNGHHHHAILQEIAHQAMLDRGLLPDFSAGVLAEIATIQTPAVVHDYPVRDLRDRLWTSIDNDDSHDLDQLTVAEAMPGDSVKIFVAVADVDSVVKPGSAIDRHAQHNTTSVYTAAAIFPMLPEKLSTNLTSLNLDEERLAIIVEMVIGADGSLQGSSIYRALVRNQAKLAYHSVAAWLDGNSGLPESAAGIDGLDENLRLQDRTAQKMKHLRHIQGALSLQTIEAKPLFDGDKICGLEVDKKNRATDIIEDFMIAANGATARYLLLRNFPSIRRVVRAPKRWDRIVELAHDHGFNLPAGPDSKALNSFLVKQQSDDPERFPDLSLTVIKLMGAGEYVAEAPGETSAGHFGLAVKNYMHSTAPNRRYTDLITQRLVKAAIDGEPSPYTTDELQKLAEHCTKQEDAANKVERQVGKSAAALILESRIGEQFDAIVTGASSKGTWARLLSIPVEGRVVHRFEGLDVGDRIHVRLMSVSIAQGYIDLQTVGQSERHLQF